jgi:hypothetical protein
LGVVAPWPPIRGSVRFRMTDRSRHRKHFHRTATFVIDPRARASSITAFFTGTNGFEIIHRDESQRLLFFGPRVVFLRLRTSNGFGRGAPLVCSEDPRASVRRCSLNSSRRIAASSSRLFGCVIGQRLSACLAIALPQQPTSRLPQVQPPKAGQ